MNRWLGKRALEGTTRAGRGYFFPRLAFFRGYCCRRRDAASTIQEEEKDRDIEGENYFLSSWVMGWLRGKFISL